MQNTINQKISSKPITSNEAQNSGKELLSTSKMIITQIPSSITKSFLSKTFSSEDTQIISHSTTEIIYEDNTERKALTQTTIPFTKTKVTINHDNTVEKTTHSSTSDEDVSTPSIRITTFEGNVSTNKAKSAQIYKMLGIKENPLKNISLGFVGTSDLPFMSSRVDTKKKDSETYDH